MGSADRDSQDKNLVSSLDRFAKKTGSRDSVNSLCTPIRFHTIHQVRAIGQALPCWLSPLVTGELSLPSPLLHIPWQIPPVEVSKFYKRV